MVILAAMVNIGRGKNNDESMHIKLQSAWGKDEHAKIGEWVIPSKDTYSHSSYKNLLLNKSPTSLTRPDSSSRMISSWSEEYFSFAGGATIQASLITLKDQWLEAKYAE